MTGEEERALFEALGESLCRGVTVGYYDGGKPIYLLGGPVEALPGFTAGVEVMAARRNSPVSVHASPEGQRHGE